MEQEGNNTLKCFITVDEAWLYYYDPTIKQQSSEWKHPSSPTLKKAKTVKSTDLSQQNYVEILPHPPYSPDVTPCDFWLFPHLKEPFRDKRFASNKA
ncbi:hypothetical protein TNCV_988391 [Trichonephila clavipes]|nr:hypothetical protein TNCV_988391 [Trichonephila clavipes]